MKPAVTAKLAHQCSDLYAEAMKLLQLDSIRGLWPKVCKDIIPVILEHIEIMSVPTYNMHFFP